MVISDIPARYLRVGLKVKNVPLKISHIEILDDITCIKLLDISNNTLYDTDFVPQAYFNVWEITIKDIIKDKNFKKFQI